MDLKSGYLRYSMHEHLSSVQSLCALCNCTLCFVCFFLFQNQRLSSHGQHVMICCFKGQPNQRRNWPQNSENIFMENMWTVLFTCFFWCTFVAFNFTSSWHSHVGCYLPIKGEKRSWLLMYLIGSWCIRYFCHTCQPWYDITDTDYWV